MFLCAVHLFLRDSGTCQLRKSAGKWDDEQRSRSVYRDRDGDSIFDCNQYSIFDCNQYPDFDRDQYFHTCSFAQRNSHSYSIPNIHKVGHLNGAAFVHCNGQANAIASLNVNWRYHAGNGCKSDTGCIPCSNEQAE